MRKLKFLTLAVALFVFTGAVLLAEDALKPADGETAIDGANADAVLAAISAEFKQSPCLKARITTEVEDLLLGKRVEEGTLLLDRAGRVLRKFSKPSNKVWLFDANQLQEYNPKRKTVFVKDLSKAPKALKLVQAAATADLKTLQEIFNIHVFEYTKDAQKHWRLVLTPKESGDSPLAYKRIQGRIAEKAIFFDEIEYVPDAGDRTLERYTDIQSIPKPGDTDFTLDVTADVKRKVDVVGTADGQ